MHWVSPLLVVLRYGRYSLCWGPIVALYIFSPSHLIFVSFFPRPKFDFSFDCHCMSQNSPFLFIAIICLFFHNQCLCFSNVNIPLNSIAMILTKFVNTQVIGLCALQGWTRQIFSRGGAGGESSDHFCGAPLPTVRGIHPWCCQQKLTLSVHTGGLNVLPLPLGAYLHLSVQVHVKVCSKKT